MSTKLELGRVRAVSVDHHWTLEAQVHAQLRPRNTTRFLSHDNILSSIKERSLWICRANGLSLAVQINQIDFVLQNGSHASAQGLLSAFKSAMANAEVRIQN